MLILLVLAILLALGFIAHSITAWALAETSEEGPPAALAVRNPRSFENHRTWSALMRLLGRGPPLLSYCRDKRGRFRKLR